MADRQGGVTDRLEVFSLRDRQVHEIHPQVHRALRVAPSAEDRHTVTTTRESPTDLLDRSFETTVCGGNTSGSDHRDGEAASSECQCAITLIEADATGCSPCRSNSTVASGF